MRVDTLFLTVAARDAATAALDAHGLAHVPSAATAYDFIRQVAEDDEDTYPYMVDAPATMPEGFAELYARNIGEAAMRAAQGR